MSDKFYPISLEKLLDWILAEERQGSIFGIHRSLIFQPQLTDRFRMERYGQTLETPIGAAAGPHTQLAAGIVSAWLTGARYLELKTVQTLDEIAVAKPCIDMADEGYNCEWSQELSLRESLDEYVKAWILIHILKDRFGWNSEKDPGFIFNMSVGYDLNGILKPNVQNFLDQMTGIGTVVQDSIELIKTRYPRIRDLNIPTTLTNNITLSTMHGCPPEEIEKIGLYLIQKRRLHTTVKLNPTLLGPDRLRLILNDKLGYDIEIPDAAFEHDLKYPAALKLIRTLQTAAAETGVEFGLKLTNTLEVKNTKSVLPAVEPITYLSGRAIHPISVNLASKLQQDFNGKLDISFSAGSDCYNLTGILACGIRPVTVCSDLLKPGGVTRLGQYLTELDAVMTESAAGTIDALIDNRAGKDGNVVSAGLKNLRNYAEDVLDLPRYKKSGFPYDTIKTPRKLKAFDCVAVPCMNTCAITQDIPTYLYHTARGNFEKAYSVIQAANPFPSVTGMVCDHLCQSKCTRINYDNPLKIREIKRFLAERSQATGLSAPGKNGKKVAIIGAGPSGLSCAYFLIQAGFHVEIFERKELSGGLVSDAIPEFRLSGMAIEKDIQAILDLGVELHLNAEVDAVGFTRLRNNFDFVYIAVGAQQNKRLSIPGEDLEGVLNPMKFLSGVRRGEPIEIGPRVVVIGGGNSAMDAARTALRLIPENGTVTVVYRRTHREMPVNHEEVVALIEEGAILIELAAPVAINRRDGKVASLTCVRMELGAVDDSGRPRPVKIPASEFELPADTIIPAIGQEVRLDFLPRTEFAYDPKSGKTGFKNVFAGGDAVRGADTLINAIGDGKRVAGTIIQETLLDQSQGAPYKKKISGCEAAMLRLSRREPGIAVTEIDPGKRKGFELVIPTLSESEAKKEAGRCLYCDEICNICVTVCPNRANISYRGNPTEFPQYSIVRKGSGAIIMETGSFKVGQHNQIINLAELCNECGNCTTFCPTSGAPYKDKPRFYLSQSSFEKEDSGYFLEGSTLFYKIDKRVATLTILNGNYHYASDQLEVEFDPDYRVKTYRFIDDGTEETELRQALVMIYLLNNLKDLYLFQTGSMA